MNKKNLFIVVLMLTYCLPLLCMENRPENQSPIVCTAEEYQYLAELYKSQELNAKPALPCSANALGLLRILEAEKSNEAKQSLPNNKKRCKYPCACEYAGCTHKLKNKRDKKLHDRYHQGGYYKCTLCQYGFDNNVGLGCHKERKHPYGKSILGEK